MHRIHLISRKIRTRHCFIRDYLENRLIAEAVHFEADCLPDKRIKLSSRCTCSILRAIFDLFIRVVYARGG